MDKYDKWNNIEFTIHILGARVMLYTNFESLNTIHTIIYWLIINIFNAIYVLYKKTLLFINSSLSFNNVY